VEPVEINAGAWYLRAPRDDDLIDDRPALADLGETDPAYVARRGADWVAETAYTWAVCEPTTGELVAEVTLDLTAATIRRRARPGHSAAAVVATESVRRFAVAALGLVIDPNRADIDL
jgi:hypothetical protein